MIKLKKNLFQGDGSLTQKFGANPAAYAQFGLKAHNGIDYGIPNDTPLYSCINGKCIESALDISGYGKYIKIENDECGVLYGHLMSFGIKVGDEVVAGQEIGRSDNTGNSTGPHLHFGVFPKPRDRSNGYSGYIDPLDKTLVEWVETFDNCESKLAVKENELDLLQVELDEMRVSRNDWKKKYNEISEKYTLELSEKQKHIESLQNTLSETNSNLTSLSKMHSDTQAELNALRIELGALKDEYDLYGEEKQGEIEVLQENLTLQVENCAKIEIELSELKKKYKMKLKSVSIWEFLKVRWF